MAFILCWTLSESMKHGRRAEAEDLTQRFEGHRKHNEDLYPLLTWKEKNQTKIVSFFWKVIN